MAEPFEVYAYDINKLISLIAEKAKAARQVVACKPHGEYFRSYFDHLQAKTIVVENEYVDRDFLEDFAAYYVRCFHDYPRKCTRLHFFDRPFSGDDLKALLAGVDNPLTVKDLQNGYLGFVVIKPLPQTVIGRTCLRTYEDDDTRSYPITRPYDANLFGIKLVVEKTLAFQEQDHVVAACATSALWSAFHGTGKQFQHAIPSPVEITKAAGPSPWGDRSLPNAGLTLEQMARAIRTMGLEPYPVRAENEFILKTTLYAYLRCHVPILMSVYLYAVSKDTPQKMGGHVVAVTGFGFGNAAENNALFRLKACSIDRIYAHDDGVGPFARMRLDGTRVKVAAGTDGQSTDRISLSTSWKTDDGQPDKVRAVPDHVLVPLYHKIRIPLRYVQNAVMQFDGLIETLRHHKCLLIPGPLQWDVYLTTVNEFKDTIFKSNMLTGDQRRSMLSASLPRYLWRATACCKDQPLLDLLFDATDIEQGECFVHAVEYDPGFSAVLRAIASNSVLEDIFGNLPAWAILQELARTSSRLT